MTDLRTLADDEVKMDMQAKECILSVEDSYSFDVEQVVKWLNDKNLRFDKEGVDEYLSYIEGVRENGERYSANSYNKKISALKSRIRLLFEKSPKSLNDLNKLQLQAYLDTLKYKKVNTKEVTEENVLTPSEIQTLINAADMRLGLMIEFMAKTGCRISEMINILISDCSRKRWNCQIRVLGKGRKERIVFIEKDFYDRILKEFNDTTYLFGHLGKTYSRISITNRIKVLSKIELQKNASAHTLRHSFITNALKKGVAIEKVSKYVGHSSVDTTDKQYNHNSLDWKELQDL